MSNELASGITNENNGRKTGKLNKSRKPSNLVTTMTAKWLNQRTLEIKKMVKVNSQFYQNTTENSHC